MSVPFSAMMTVAPVQYWSVFAARINTDNWLLVMLTSCTSNVWFFLYCRVYLDAISLILVQPKYDISVAVNKTYPIRMHTISCMFTESYSM